MRATSKSKIENRISKMECRPHGGLLQGILTQGQEGGNVRHGWRPYVQIAWLSERDSPDQPMPCMLPEPGWMC